MDSRASSMEMCKSGHGSLASPGDHVPVSLFALSLVGCVSVIVASWPAGRERVKKPDTPISPLPLDSYNNY